MILFCPDLVGKEEVKAMIVGHGDFVRPVLNACIKKMRGLQRQMLLEGERC